MSFQVAIDRLYHRIMLVIGRGRITTLNDAGAVQLMQVKLGALETTDNLPRLAEYGFNSNPPVGSDAVLLFVGGNRTNGVVIATGNQQFRMKSLAPGEVSLSDNLGQTVYLSQAGIVVKGAGLPMKLTNTPSITLDTPSVVMTGNVTVQGNLTEQANLTVDQTTTTANLEVGS